MIKVDHVEEYKVPKFKENVSEETMKLWTEGCAPKPIAVEDRGLQEKAEEKERSEKKDRKKEKKLAKKMKKEKKRHEAKKLDELDEGLMDIGQLDSDLKELLQKRKEERRKKKEDKKRMIRGEEMEDRSGMDKDDWKDQKGLFMDRRFEGEEFDYTEKFGKRKTPEPEEQKYNVRPDFDKADWRDIELFKIVREQSQKKNVEWKDEEHYVPKRFG
uniref:Protein KRI1 homolog n=1 Tax=Steinernema glaseri TaxID=37863 RepID=A0A1I8AUM5_9BILA